MRGVECEMGTRGSVLFNVQVASPDVSFYNDV